MRTLLTRIMAWICLALAATLAWSASSGAEAPDVAGWWNRLKPDLPQTLVGNPIPPPPDVEQGQLLVASDVLGAQAIAALRFPASRPAAGVLTVVPASPAGVVNAEVAACPVTSSWDGVEDGKWADRPSVGTECVPGEIGADGTTIRFPIGERYFREGAVVSNIEIGIVPTGSSAFRLTLEKLAEDAFVPSDGQPLLRPELFALPDFGSATEPGPAPGPEPVPAAARPSAAPVGPASPEPAFTPPPPDISTPRVAPDPVLSATPELRVEPTLALPESSDSSTERLVAMALLGALGMVLMGAGRTTPAEPMLIGGLARRQA